MSVCSRTSMMKMVMMMLMKIVTMMMMIVTIMMMMMVQVETHECMLEENGVRLALTVVDTPGYGDAVDNT